MNRYFIRTPWLLKKLFPSYIWNIDTKENVLYLSFDDGPHPEATSFVLDELSKYKAKATFFCIGKNVMAFPDIFRRVIEEGHAIGNHTQNHLNGWKTKDEVYLRDAAEASKYIDSALFRPPYGRIRSFQAKNMHHAIKSPGLKIVMWTVLSADFDPAVTSEQCLHHVILNATKGSIVVFHDSAKALPRLQYALPAVLKFFTEKGFRFESLVEKTHTKAAEEDKKS
jgi:peptidoglycan/xylan/chitin deacetylase (PgdA/CDA1 family)